MNKQDLINDYERLDDLQRDNLFLIQDPRLFCFGVDAVFLSHFAKIKTGDRVLDLCTGNGIVPVLLSTSNALEIYGIEIQKQSFDLAKRNVIYNNLNDKVHMLNMDAKDAVATFEAGSFHVITVNPPYMNEDGGFRNQMEEKSIARHEVLITLLDIIIVSKKLLRFGGRFYMVHRPARLAEIIACMSQNGIEPKTLRFVHSYIDKEPSLVLIEGTRGGNPMTRVLPPLVIYERDGQYTKEIYEIYGMDIKSLV